MSGFESEKSELEKSEFRKSELGTKVEQLSRYWSPVVHTLTPYVPGEQPKLNRLIKLNTNENPYPPSEMVLAAIQAETIESLKLYPDPNADLLKQAIGDYYGVSAQSVFVGNGSDEVLAHTFGGLLKHDLPILYPDITYSFYPVFCKLYEIESIQIPLDASFQIRIEDYLRPNGGIIFPNPNAPTGCLLPLEQIAQLATQTDAVVVIDEAYIDFGGETAIALIDQHPNLLIIQTCSKGRSLAGLRVGFAVGNPVLIEALERVKNSFNSYPLGRLAIAGAVAAFRDRDYFEQTRQAVVASREWLIDQLYCLGFKVLPSAANFVFVHHPDHDAAQLAAALRERNIIVRHFRLPRIDQFLRISIGTDPECQALVSALEDWLGAQSRFTIPPA
ncbi:MAG: histidinol-phosphate transaminase [Elainella sp. Prado103]|jgi:histidinol-phosphate aminotransferase|nr:histidinol-phosphate transaminase [Elainella sp. Prado103]